MSDAANQHEVDPDDVTPERVFERYRQAIDADNKSLTAEAHHLLDNLSAHRVLFAPLCEFDITPLHRFSHMFDLFIFSDWRLTNAEVDDVLLETDGFADKGLGHSHQMLPGVRVNYDPAALAEFGNLDGLPWIFDARRPQSLEPFVKVVQLRRRVGEVWRYVWYVAIGGNPLSVYEHLFTNKGIAPEMVWVPSPLGVQQQDWHHFIAPGGPLGRLFAQDAPQPKFVAASSYHQGWLQRTFFQRCLLPMPGFNVGIWTIPGSQAPQPVPNVLPGLRTIGISRTPIYAAKVADDELIVLTEREFEQQLWPAQRVLLSTHAVQAAQQQQPMLPRLPLCGQPLPKALKLLEDYCRGHGLKRVAASRLGYEDEGPLLNEWRKEAGSIERLTLHCEGDGDWLSVGGYGEVI